MLKQYVLFPHAMFHHHVNFILNVVNNVRYPFYQALLLMRYLSVNLLSPEFEEHVSALCRIFAGWLCCKLLINTLLALLSALSCTLFAL